jgi:peptidyl-prolyl cis-trans isomerase D
MFDLFRSRDKAVRILLGALLVLVGFSMLTYLIPNYNTGGNANDMVVAEVGKDAITQLEVQRLIQNTMRGRQLPPEILPNYVPQLVNNLITERALAYEAERQGFVVTDAQLSQAIQQLVPNLFPDGKFVGRDAYAALLAQQNLSIPEFEADMRRQLMITRMRDIALEGTIVTPLEIEQEYRKRNEKVKIEYVKIPSDKYKAEAEPSLADMQTYFKANTARYTVPERKSMAILLADQAKIEQTVNPADADLHRMYSQNQSDFRVPETVKVRHILLKTQGKPPADEPKIKAQADDILKQVRSGANFADLVKKYSEDTASIPNGGEYSVMRNGQTVPEFENAAFTLKPGQSDVIKTTYGYHVIQVMQHDPARLRPFEEVKGELAANWKKQRVSDLMQQIGDKAQAMLQKDPAHPEKVASELNMQLVHAENVEPGGPLPEVGTNADLNQALSGLKKGEVAPAVAIPGNKVVVAEVTDVTSARPATFEEVQGKVRDQMIQTRMVNAVQNHARELLDKAKAMGGDLAKAAKSMGLEAKTTNDFSRTGTVEGIGPATYVQEAFSRPDGSLVGPISMPDGTAVVRVVSHAQPDMSKLPEQRGAIREDLKRQKASDRNALYEAGVREDLIRRGKVKIHQDVINRMMASYRTSS